MGRYDPNLIVEEKGPGWKIHPVWRGIGCIMMVLLPAMSYAGAVELVKANYYQGWVRMPVDLAGPPQYPYLYAYLLVGTVLLLVSFATLIIIYSMIYGATAGPRHGRLDAPPERLKKKKKYR